ncbi:MAG: hypothetical protein KC457_33085, partial [Myxococcales bacterium]|nr:hypothetical protein [Myxococcales bacterium]
VYSKTEPLGVIITDNCINKREISTEDIEGLKLFASQASSAIENARLYKALDEHSKTLEQKVRERTSSLEEKNNELAVTLETLRTTQARVIAQEKLAALGTLTAGVAHELRNPLNFVNNFAEMAQDLHGELGELLEPLTAEADGDTKADLDDVLDQLREGSRAIHEHGRRASRILDGMQMLAGRGQGQARAVDLNALVDSTIKVAYHGAGSRYTNLRVQVVPRLDRNLAPVEVVAGDFNHAVLNLLANAIHAAHSNESQLEPGTLPQVIVSTEDLGTSVRVSVIDNGAGISAELRSKIFTPFFTTKPPNEGVGLGLSISHDIVRRHGGTLELASEPGEPTRFDITLPKHRPST